MVAWILAPCVQSMTLHITHERGAYAERGPMRILMLLWLVPVLNAQGGGAPWSDLRSKNPPGLSVTLRLMNPHAFRQGELIAAELNLPDHPPTQTPPPAAHWQFAGRFNSAAMSSPWRNACGF